MSTYELDDDLARRLVETTYAPDKMDAACAVAELLRPQLPQELPPLPTNLWAVIRTDCGVFVRWSTDPMQGIPWQNMATGANVNDRHVGTLVDVYFEGIAA